MNYGIECIALFLKWMIFYVSAAFILFNCKAGNCDLCDEVSYNQYRTFSSLNVIPVEDYFSRINHCVAGRESSLNNKVNITSEFGNYCAIRNVHEWVQSKLPLYSQKNPQYSRWFNCSIVNSSSCHYDVKNKLSAENGVYYSKSIVQYCPDETDFNNTNLGGSSFEVMTIGDFLHKCEVTELLDSTYDVSCKLPIVWSHINANQQNVINMNTTTNDVVIILDFEKYDAFYAFCLISRPQLIKREKIWKEIIQIKWNSFIPNHDQQVQNHKIIQYQSLSLGIWVKSEKPFDIFIPEYDLIAPHFFLRKNENGLQINANSYHYTWKWFNHTMISNPENSLTEYASCVDKLKDNKIILVGSSHMRYNWDAITFLMQFESRENNSIKFPFLDRKHPSSKWKNIHFQHLLFAESFPILLKEVCKNVSSSNYSENYVLFLQTGSWDLSFWSLDYLIEVGGHVIIESLKDLMKQRCDANIRIVWMTTVPYPDCTVDMNNDSNIMYRCSSNRRGRNNYVISAWNNFILNGLMKLNYPNLQIIDAYSIIEPRLQFGETVCTNHFSCNDKALMFTPAGWIVIESFFRAMCNVV